MDQWDKRDNILLPDFAKEESYDKTSRLKCACSKGQDSLNTHYANIAEN